jgi:hypothetical protein
MTTQGQHTAWKPEPQSIAQANGNAKPYLHIWPTLSASVNIRLN